MQNEKPLPILAKLTPEFWNLVKPAQRAADFCQNLQNARCRRMVVLRGDEYVDILREAVAARNGWKRKGWRKVGSKMVFIRYPIHLKIIPHCCGIKLRELAVKAKDRCVIRMNYSVLSTRADDAACIAGTAGRTAFS